MSIVGKRNSLVNVSPRNFSILTQERDFTVPIQRRNFTSSVSKREFGVAIIGWRVWGQGDIYPFMTGGVDSTKTFGDLP